VTNQERFTRLLDAYLHLVEKMGYLEKIIAEQQRLISALQGGGQQDKKEPKYED
jgi:hypothetical protein